MSESFTRNAPVPPLRLRAEDRADLRIIAACLQDAVVKRDEMTYLPKQRRFAAVLNRFRWERETTQEKGARLSPQRVRTGLHFDGVFKVKTRNLDNIDKETVLSLLTVDCRSREDGSGEITLVFADDRDVRLEVECIDVHLTDITEPWRAKGRPDHSS